MHAACASERIFAMDAARREKKQQDAFNANQKVTMDIYAKVKYNKPWELAPVINQAFSTNSEKESA